MFVYYLGPSKQDGSCHLWVKQWAWSLTMHYMYGVGFTELVPTQSSYSGKAEGLGLYPTQISLGIRVLIHAGGWDQRCLVIQFLDKTQDMNKEYSHFKKKDEYVYLSHIFSYIKSYVFNFFFLIFCRLWIDDYWILKNRGYA
jgi:hypothetical protein